MTGKFAKSKGARGERAAIDLLNDVIERVLESPGAEWDLGTVGVVKACIQRNQNQSAVGGNDLNGVFGISVEVKRQETLHINAWWDQTVKAASRNQELPVLMYKQNHQPWMFYTLGEMYLPNGMKWQTRIRIDEDAFKIWFYQWVYLKMQSGDLPRI